ncbi:hypothetical protein KKG56_10290 [bacterium]|nr:hypothetical protein [bacterium]
MFFHYLSSWIIVGADLCVCPFLCLPFPVSALSIFAAARHAKKGSTSDGYSPFIVAYWQGQGGQHPCYPAATLCPPLVKKQIPLAKGIPTADCQAAAAIRRVSSSTKFKLMPHNLILSYGRGNKQKRTGTSPVRGLILSSRDTQR